MGAVALHVGCMDSDSLCRYFSSGVGYTLQIVGQKGLNPAVASVAMSLESVVSVIAGWILLDQMLAGREIFGCVLMFIAIIIAQLPDREYTK